MSFLATLDNVEVSSLRVTVGGFSGTGATLKDILATEVNRHEQVWSAIFEKNWDRDSAEMWAYESLVEEFTEDWIQTNTRRHPDLFGGQTPIIIDEPIPDFEPSDEMVSCRANENYNDEAEWCWREIEAHLKKGDDKEALGWLGIKEEDCSIDEFKCVGCGDWRDWNGIITSCCHNPYCPSCHSTMHCIECGDHLEVEDHVKIAAMNLG